MLLLLSSVACVAVLTASLAEGRATLPSVAIHVRDLILIAVTGAMALLALFAVWATTRSAQAATRKARDEARKLQRALQATEAIVKAESQVLIFWAPGEPLNVVTHTLHDVPGLPRTQVDLLKFGNWLSPNSAHDLKSALDTLFAAGRPFNLLLKTTAGGPFEAEGRATGSRAVLRFRGIAGYRSDLVRLLDQHHEVSRSAKVAYGLLDALPFPVWFRDNAQHITWANAAYARAVEAKDTGEVVSRQLELLESRERAQVTQQLASGATYARRMHLIIDGERRAHDLFVRPVDGVAAAAAVDVNALETAEGELSRQISAYARTLDRVKSAVAIFDTERRLTFYNHAWQQLWRLEPVWLDAKPSHGEILDRLRELSRLPGAVDYRQWKTKLLSEPYLGDTYEDWWHFPDGRLLHVVAEPRPDGGVTYLYDDATERVALESRFNSMIRVQRETLDTLKEGVAVFGTDGRLQLHNTAFRSIWRLSTPLLEDSPHIERISAQTRLLCDEPHTWARLARSVTALLDKRETLEGQLTRPDGSVIDYASVPLPDGATLLTFSDVTANKQYERALIERNEALVAADRLKSQFISHVSYELRTPLTNIIGFSELLVSPRTGPLNQKQREYLGDIMGSSTTLLSIIDDILDLATIDAGALELRLSPVRVREVIDQAVTGVRERAGRSRIRLEVDVTDPDLALIADESRLRQILYNLTSNAIAFSTAGGEVRIRAQAFGPSVAFIVEDDGVGIPKDQQARVFDRFESASTTGKPRGTGLGLAIVKSLVELHAGDMSLDSEPGRGTRVTVRLPRNGAAEAGAPPVAARA